jgi:two-component system cell cycle sensor histidine kinase/response regulator CckA
VETEPTRGTTFRLLFPVTVNRDVTESQPIPRNKTYTSSGTILVVDDEESVRSVASASLVRCGFTVLTALNGRDGMAAFQAKAGDIRAMVLDLTMPEMGGEEVLAALRSGGGPGASVPVLVSSGYSTADLAAGLQRHGGVTFLQKPYGPEDLIQKMRECLGE